MPWESTTKNSASSCSTVAGGVFQNLVASGAMSGAKVRVGLDGDDLPAACAEAGADRQVVRARGADFEKNAAKVRVDEELRQDFPIDILFGRHIDYPCPLNELARLIEIEPCIANSIAPLSGLTRYERIRKAFVFRRLEQMRCSLLA